MNFPHNPLRPHLLLVLIIMFALIAVIVKRETRSVSVQQSAISFYRAACCRQNSAGTARPMETAGHPPHQAPLNASADRPGALLNRLGIAQEPGPRRKESPVGAEFASVPGHSSMSSISASSRRHQAHFRRLESENLSENISCRHV